MQRVRSLYFTAPNEIEIRETSLPGAKDDELLVESICSAISAGTEMLVYRGQYPQTEDPHDGISSDLKYPLAYGYACVGRVLEVGKSVDGKWKDRLVFAFQPHISHFIAKTEALMLIPESLSPENACFLPNMETAVNLVQDGAPILGERVLVLGQGIVGLLTTALLSEFPLEVLLAVDRFQIRCNASTSISRAMPLDRTRIDFDKHAKAILKNKADLTYELSGNPSALNDALELTEFNGRIVIGSWYGEKKTPIKLGGDFHRSRIKLVSSQVSTIAPELSARWDKARRFEVAWRALKRINPEKWITQRFSIEDADKAYHLLDENPQETIQVILEY